MEGRSVGEVGQMVWRNVEKESVRESSGIPYRWKEKEERGRLSGNTGGYDGG